MWNSHYGKVISAKTNIPEITANINMWSKVETQSQSSSSTHISSECMLSRFNRVWLFGTPQTVARQPPLSLGFSMREYWNGLPCPPPGGICIIWVQTAAPPAVFRPWCKSQRNVKFQALKFPKEMWNEPHFKIHLTATKEFPHNLHLKVINLLKRKHQEKNVIEFYKCLSSDKYAQLKILCSWTDTSMGRYLSMGRHFQRWEM